MTNENTIVEAQPVEAASTEMMRITSDGDPDLMLSLLEKKAALAPRWAAAIGKILISQTYPEDWTQQGENMCLSSAGAERVGRAFPINVYNVQYKREDFTDGKGSGYRYVFSGFGQMSDRTVYAEGVYSTRDEFLGKKGGEYRPLEDINENDIRAAANHIFMGNVIKGLLGLRNIPKSQYDQMMQSVGKNPAASKAVTRGSGTQGGTTQEDTKLQLELANICLDITHAGLTVTRGDDGSFELIESPVGPGDKDEALIICKEISGFVNKDGKKVDGKGAKDLKGKWLESTLKQARELKKIMEAMQ